MSAARKAREPVAAEAAIWQDVEFGSYTADLPLFEQLAGAGEATVLELGAGSGRVGLHLARLGIPVTAIERDPELAEELGRRAEAEGLPLSPLPGDIAELEAALPRAPEPIRAAIAPLHVIQQIDPGERPRLLAALAELLPARAPMVAVLVDESSLLGEGIGAADKVPDMREVDGWVYSSEPLWVQVGERELRIRRLRERVSPGGEIERGVHDELLHRLLPEALEAEAEGAGFTPRERRAIRSGPAEADSIAVLMEAP